MFWSTWSTTLWAPRCRKAPPTNPLYDACVSGDADAVTALLAQGACPNSLAPHGQCTCLFAAASRAHLDIVRALLDHGAAVDVPAFPTQCLHTAAYLGDVAMAALLLDRGANIEHAGADGSTPLCFAIAWGQPETLELLLNRGANVHFRRADGRSAVDMLLKAHMQDVKARHRCLALLLQYGARIPNDWACPADLFREILHAWQRDMQERRDMDTLPERLQEAIVGLALTCRGNYARPVTKYFTHMIYANK